MQVYEGETGISCLNDAVDNVGACLLLPGLDDKLMNRY